MSCHSNVAAHLLWTASVIPLCGRSISGPREFSLSQHLIVLGGDVAHDRLDGAVQDAAEVVDGRGVHGPVFPQLVERGAGDAVAVDQRVRGLLRRAQRIPERFIGNHKNHPFRMIVKAVLFLDYGRKKDYNS